MCIRDSHDDYPQDQGVKIEEEPCDDNSDSSESVEDMDTEVSVQDTFANTGNRRRSLRRRRPPQRYTPQLNAGGRQSYSYNGAVHLSYRGNRYLMNPKDGIVCLNLGGKPGVDNDPEMQYIDGVLNLNLAGRATEEQVPMNEGEVEEHLLGVALAQYSLKKRIELFGDEAEKAATKELQQIDDMDTYIPVDPRNLSAEDRRKALSALFFLTRKRDGRLKGRKCAIGSKQRTYDGVSEVGWDIAHRLDRWGHHD